MECKNELALEILLDSRKLVKRKGTLQILINLSNSAKLVLFQKLLMIIETLYLGLNVT